MFGVLQAKSIALIPARGGSKRIPRKNIKHFDGKPIICWSIEAALESTAFERVIVSTDDEAIADVARAAGAEVPFLRPADISDDITPTRDVIIHAINALELAGTPVDLLCCLYATAPFITPSALNGAKQELLSAPDVNFVFAACTFPYPIQRALVAAVNDGVKMLFPEHAATRSQDLPEAFHDAGQFYWGRRDAFVNRVPMFSETARPYFLDRLDVQDIDTPQDWDVAEALFKLRKEKQ